MSDAFFLMVVGMVTVFVVLFFVVFVGNLIILFINRFVPAAVVEPVAAKRVQAASGVIASNKLSAIVAAVDIASHGKARIVSIEKK